MAKEGLYGSETRAEVKNPLEQNRGQRQQPNSISLSGVSAPRNADFSQIGEGQRVMSKLLGDTAGILDNYVEKNRKQWELDGQMAYAQGVAEQDLAKTGNKYTMAGFLTMKTQTAATQFLQNEYENIDKTARELSPEEYRASLSQRYSEMSKQLGDDPFIGRLLGAAAAEAFPKLVAQQTKSNNEWRKNETKLSYRNLLVSESTMNDPQSPDGGSSPDRLRKLISPEVSGLKLEDHKEVITDALNLTLQMGDTRLAKSFFGADKVGGIAVKDLPPEKVVMNQAIDYVLGIEGGYTGDDAGAGPTNMGINSTANPDIDVAKLTPDEARILYEERYWKPVVTSDMNPDMAIAAFDSAVNQGVGFTKKALAESGGDLDKFIKLRKERYIETAKIPGKEKFLENWLGRLAKLETASAAGRPMAKTVEALVDQKRIVLAMSANGFSEAQIKEVSSAYKAGTEKKDLEFDQNRILTEQALLNQARKDGNLPARLAQIADTQAANGYSDKWANQMADKAVTQVNEYDKEQKEYNRLDTVAAAGGLANESGEKQKTAIDRKRNAIVGKFSAKEDLNDDQKNQAIRQEMTDFLVRNGVVDSTWEKSIATGLQGDVVQKDGTINPRALKAYQDYLFLKQNAPAGYAQNYVKGDAAKLVAQAEALDINMNSDQALLTAAQIASKTNTSTDFTPKTASEAEVNKVIDKKVEEELNPGFFSFISRFQAADAFDVKDSDIAEAKQSPVLRSYLTSKANTILQSDLTGKTSVEAAVNEAWNGIVNRIELAPSGNVLISGPGKTIREELGYPKAHATNLVFKALQRFAAYNGKAYFGPRYIGNTEEADRQFAMFKVQNPSANTTGNDERWIFGKTRDAMSGIHPSSFVNDPDRKGIVWQLMKEDDMGNQIPDGDPKFIPYSVLGDFMREQDFKERSERTFTDYAKHAIQDIKQQVVGRD